MNKKHKIVMLPTEDALAPLGVMSYSIDSSVKGDVVLAIPEYNGEAITKQHLYIISDDEIKEGDWFIDNNHGELGAILAHGNIVVAANIHKTLCKKIIATTDPKLQVDYKESYEVQGVMMKGSHLKHLPRIPQSLVEYYAKHQPEEVELEYNEPHIYNMCSNPKDHKSCIKLKLVENEVVWVETERCDCPPLVACEICEEEKNLDGDFWKNKKKHDKLYTRKEVEKLFIEFREDHLYTFDMTSEKDFKQWLKDNL